jgi:hypothetical protein
MSDRFGRMSGVSMRVIGKESSVIQQNERGEAQRKRRHRTAPARIDPVRRVALRLRAQRCPARVQ